MAPLFRPKPDRHQLPWLSLLLLFGNYALMGRLLAHGAYSTEVTVFLVVGSFAIALIYLHPLADLSRFVQRWFSSDTLAFSTFVMTAATVSIRVDGDVLRLRVADNGIGIGDAPKANGGLSNMVWRAAELGGSCSVATASPAGTVIDWHVPL